MERGGTSMTSDLLTIPNSLAADPSTCAARSPGLARTLCLDRWARHRAIGTEHAAITLARTQHRAAAGTSVEELAGIGRHSFRFGGSAKRAGDNALKHHSTSPSRRRVVGSAKSTADGSYNPWANRRLALTGRSSSAQPA